MRSYVPKDLWQSETAIRSPVTESACAAKRAGSGDKCDQPADNRGVKMMRPVRILHRRGSDAGPQAAGPRPAAPRGVPMQPTHAGSWPTGARTLWT